MLYINHLPDDTICNIAIYADDSTTQLVLFYRSINTGAIDVKTDESILEEKSSLKMLGLSYIGLRFLYCLYC